MAQLIRHRLSQLEIKLRFERVTSNGNISDIPARRTLVPFPTIARRGFANLREIAVSIRVATTALEEGMPVKLPHFSLKMAHARPIENVWFQTGYKVSDA